MRQTIKYNIELLEKKMNLGRKFIFLSLLLAFTIMITTTLCCIVIILTYNEENKMMTAEEYFKIDEDASLYQLAEVKGDLVHAGRFDAVPVGTKYDRMGLPMNRKWLTASEWQGKHLKDPIDKSMFKTWKVIHMNTFLDYIKPAAKAESKVPEYSKILPSLISAQAILESGFGLSRVAVMGDNLYGHKCHTCSDSANFIIAHDDSPDDRFRVKSSRWVSIRDHSKLLMSKYFHRIPINRQANPDIRDWLNALCNCGRELSVDKAKEAHDRGEYSYATSCYTDEGYAIKIMNYIKTYKLDKLDE